MSQFFRRLMIIALLPALVQAQEQVVRCAVINGMNITGFWQAVSEKFEKDTGIKVQTVAFGEKDIIDEAFRTGEIDLITMHASDRIINLVADGLAMDPQPWVRNDLVLVGPPEDPAKIKGTANAGEAFRKIAESKSPLVVHASLGAQGVLRAIVDEEGIEFDESKITMLFADAQRQVLQIAAEKKAYTMVGRIPFRIGRIPNAGLELMSMGDDRLRRPYVVAVANPKRFPNARITLARRLAGYLRSRETQAWIAEWGRGQLDDRSVFFPIVLDTPATRPAGVLAQIRGEGLKSLDISSEIFANLPRTEVKAADEAGRQYTYSGVLVRDILKAAGAALGDHLFRPPDARRAVYVSATDGYVAVFSLAEFDNDFAERSILLADRRDGAPLDARQGPLRIIMPQEKRLARWVRGVTLIEIR